MAQSIWRPALETSWQWQLTGTVDLSVDVQMYDVDLFTTDAATVSQIHALGRIAVCYVSVGTYEPYRPDFNMFPAIVKGKVLADFPDEQWLDIRRLDLLGPIIESRLDLCKAKGFDGVEPDNVDGYTNRTGFPLTASDQLKFNRFVAAAAHTRGLSVGLKNDLDQVNDLLPSFDWALNEQCFQYNECDFLKFFIQAGKAVFQVEYERQPAQFCSQANMSNFNSLRKSYDLGSYRQACREVPRVTVTNSASYATAGIAPGLLVTLFGTDLGPNEAIGMQLTSDGTVDTILGGTRVLFNSQPAPLTYAASGQVTAIVPYAVANHATVVIELERNEKKQLALTFPVVPAQPGLFQGSALNEDGTVNGPENPARRGSTLTLFGTGEGLTDPEGVETRLNSAGLLPRPTLPVTLEIGGVDAPIQFAGAVAGAPPGLFQVSVRIPDATPTGGAITVTLAVGGMLSQAGATVAIQ